MTNIKNNKLLLLPHLNLKPSPLSAKNVSFFKNPNSLAGSQTCESRSLPSLATSQVELATSLAANAAKPEQEVAAAVDPNLPLALLALPKLIEPKPKLVFLQKKGSQIPNPNIINYNFPGAGAAKHKINTEDMNKLLASCSRPSLRKNNLYKLLFYFFKSMYCLISKPVFITTPDKIKIQLFYFLCIPKFFLNKTVKGKGKGKAFIGAAANRPSLARTGSSNAAASEASIRNERLLLQDLNVKVNLKRLTQSNLTKVYPHKFKLICTILSKFFNKNVELELIRLHQPYYDSNILVNFLALIINKKNIGACIQRLYNSNIIKANKALAQEANVATAALPLASYNLQLIGSGEPALSKQRVAAYLSGLNIKISGRLMREPIIPRITTKKFEKGFTAKGKINYFDLARFTHKNRKGAFTITVKSGQNF